MERNQSKLLLLWDLMKIEILLCLKIHSAGSPPWELRKSILMDLEGIRTIACDGRFGSVVFGLEILFFLFTSDEIFSFWCRIKEIHSGMAFAFLLSDCQASRGWGLLALILFLQPYVVGGLLLSMKAPILANKINHCLGANEQLQESEGRELWKLLY